MKDNQLVKVGKRLKELRTAKGLSQKALGEKLGIAQNTIAQYEKELANPSLDILVKLADFFDTTTDYILGRIDFE